MDEQRAINLLPPRDDFYWEARRICYERGIESEDSLQNTATALRHRAFMGAIQPMLRARASIAALDVRPMTLTADGLIRHGEMPKEVRKLDEQLNETIILAAQQFGMHYCPLPPAAHPRNTSPDIP